MCWLKIPSKSFDWIEMPVDKGVRQDLLPDLQKSNNLFIQLELWLKFDFFDDETFFDRWRTLLWRLKGFSLYCNI